MSYKLACDIGNIYIYLHVYAYTNIDYLVYLPSQSVVLLSPLEYVNALLSSSTKTVATVSGNIVPSPVQNQSLGLQHTVM